MRIKKNDGFTLIELLVVIAVLGILSAIVIPRISGITNQAKRSALESTASSLQSNIEMAIAEGEADEIGIDTANNWINFDADTDDDDPASVSMSQPDNISITGTDNSVPSDNADNSYEITLEHSGFSENNTVTINQDGIE